MLRLLPKKVKQAFVSNFGKGAGKKENVKKRSLSFVFSSLSPLRSKQNPKIMYYTYIVKKNKILFRSEKHSGTLNVGTYMRC